MKETLSERNHNPLNIRSTKITWNGQTGINKGFAVFADDAHGWRAAAYLLVKYIVRYRKRTVAEIINRWAPLSENNTKGYIERVCKIMSKVAKTTSDTKIEKTSQLITMMLAMVEVERGLKANVKDAEALGRGIILFLSNGPYPYVCWYKMHDDNEFAR